MLMCTFKMLYVLIVTFTFHHLDFSSQVIIFALQRTQRIGHKRAEQMFKSEERNAMEVTGALDDVKFPSYLTEEERKNMLENVPKRAARQLGFSPREFGLS